MPTAEQDIMLIVGGRFARPSLGPALYDGTLQRARASAGAYLQKFEEMFLGMRFDAAYQSNLYLPTFLEYVQESEPAKVSDIASRLLRQYDAVLVLYDAAKDRKALLALVPEETANVVYRLEERRAELRALAQGAR